MPIIVDLKLDISLTRPGLSALLRLFVSLFALDSDLGLPVVLDKH
jgi:hypothetical protein